ncbi:MAG: hypothetical protein ACYC6B_08780 [Thermoleophilia bacterium]
MTDGPEFPHLQAAARRLKAADDMSREQLRELICHDCAFWHEEHEDELECSCFMILKLMLERGIMTPTSLAAAVGPRRKDK